MGVFAAALDFFLLPRCEPCELVERCEPCERCERSERSERCELEPRLESDELLAAAVAAPGSEGVFGAMGPDEERRAKKSPAASLPGALPVVLP